MFHVCRETDTIEQHAEAMVSLLESCLNHNLKPSATGEDPPHAKISSDIISCIFLVIVTAYNLEKIVQHLANRVSTFSEL